MVLVVHALLVIDFFALSRNFFSHSFEEKFFSFFTKFSCSKIFFEISKKFEKEQNFCSFPKKSFFEKTDCFSRLFLAETKFGEGVVDTFPEFGIQYFNFFCIEEFRQWPDE